MKTATTSPKAYARSVWCDITRVRGVGSAGDGRANHTWWTGHILISSRKFLALHAALRYALHWEKRQH
jgi:hypothetical protein